MQRTLYSETFRTQTEMWRAWDRLDIATDALQNALDDWNDLELDYRARVRRAHRDRQLADNPPVTDEAN